MILKNQLIKLLGGYTQKEYTRLERKYQGLLDSKTTDNTVSICNEYIYRVLKELDDYAKSLYGSSVWATKMYNVIHNNLLRVMSRYVSSKSSIIYSIDTTLDGTHEFENIIKKERQLI